MFYIVNLIGQSYGECYNKDNYKVRRIPARKSLNISENLQIRGIEISENNAIIGRVINKNFEKGKLYNRYTGGVGDPDFSF